MDKLNIVGALKSYAVSQRWHFLYGSRFMQNYEADQKEYKNGDLILAVFPFKSNPKYTGGGTISEVTYTGIIMLGQKFDDDGTEAIPDNDDTPDNEEVKYNDGTPASLDETQIQKYERRLKDLIALVGQHIGSFACANELEVVSCTIEEDLNKFDTLIDFALAQITFKQ